MLSYLSPIFCRSKTRLQIFVSIFFIYLHRDYYVFPAIITKYNSELASYDYPR